MSEPGHNSVPGEELRSYVARIERLNEERTGLASDIRDLLKEAASRGFDKAALRQVIAIRKRDPKEVEAENDLIDLYMRTLGE